MRVNEARKIQVERYKKYKIYSNAELKEIMEKVFNKMGLSARAYNRILKVARTIADLDKQENIQAYHIAEAVKYRHLDKKYF